MPIIKSAKKRVRVAAKARARNLHTRREVRRTLKAYTAAVESGKPVEVAKAHKEAMSALDIAAKKAVMHKNKAARYKAKLASLAKTAGIKPGKAVVKKPTAKTASKKTASKK
ncbi:MAG TPA: 30S ribosomal protein S20 [Candidatus Saccharimonadales bacterium]|nr:30S ribosomal protein S20 [Candidatus Saccharimonadales bacterium]